MTAAMVLTTSPLKRELFDKEEAEYAVVIPSAQKRRLSLSAWTRVKLAGTRSAVTAE